MPQRVFLITPPFTQLNTPYPATAYLKGFLNTRQIDSFQADLGIEVTLDLFSRDGLINLFTHIGKNAGELSPNAKRILSLAPEYISSIDPVLLFLQGKNPTLAHLICKRDFLPEADRFRQLDDLNWAFGSMGTQDMAKHLATLYLEDLSDLIKECVDEHFGFSRYAEKIARSASSFDGLYEMLHQPLTYIDRLLADRLQRHFKENNFTLVAISVPFPGNLYSALRCGAWVKQRCPGVKVVMGGGYANTELRSITDARVFEFVDFITLDDGERPLENLILYLDGHIQKDELKRTFVSEAGNVVYYNRAATGDYKQAEMGTPDYSDLLLDKYISAIEVMNPMHRLWSDGRWNKLTMAHGCYWGKCTFCDISLDYIRLYEPITASMLCDRIETLIQQTGENGFHFVDEAAPPALMRALALEIIRRKLIVSWWTNIRFEKSFTRDLCLLLKASGCIAVSGGLEVASDRLLSLINKGITVAQVARVTCNFTDAGIMVHAYLMYGFPTQTVQETIDSLEMVRQLFKNGILQSGFWHQFTMTAHSPVGLYPEQFSVEKLPGQEGSFANNDLLHHDPAGAQHEQFSYGLKKSLLNYMHGLKLEDPLFKWFDFKTPKTTIAADYILNIIRNEEAPPLKANPRVLWLGKIAASNVYTQSKKGMSREMINVEFVTRKQVQEISFPKEQGAWLLNILPSLTPDQKKIITQQELKESYEAAGLDDFELFWDNKPIAAMYKLGLLKL